ncbi:sugar phosphate isomerase/epimerase family protein [Parapedobacter sp. 10938]|uniref:sugar phosphate isomerase/epimerase family protein n=1 Tax=Parapedobacter flavus TaxID=3110225 RepID=UPI002DBC2359|nr:TIM barrel protein [Parapedobacter sp. 10938]MEC3880521.1 TIM barrel protein [Parapedobacter sp. 10938]
MNHIKHPERLIRALGKRLKHVHIADGTGDAENHWLPCSGKGNNDWPAILAALDEAGYAGPFMYECA